MLLVANQDKGSGPGVPARSAGGEQGPALPPGVPEELDRTAGRILDAKHFLALAIQALVDGDAPAALVNAGYAKAAAHRSPTVREALGIALYATGDFKQALAELQTFRRLTGSTVHDAQIADCYRGLGRPERAVTFLDEAGPPSTEHGRRGMTLIRAGALADMGEQAGAEAALRLGGIPGETLKPAGSLPPGSVGSTADNPRRKIGKRPRPRSGR